MTTVSVIIPSYNSSKTVQRTLDGLAAQTRGGRIVEILVVDSSDDGETKMILQGKQSDKVRVIHAPTKTMPGMGRNIGAAEARGEILAFIDSDAFPMPDWVEEIVSCYEKGRRVGGGSIGLPDFQKSKPIAMAQYYLQFNEYLPGGHAGVKKMIPSCNLYCEARLFKQLRGFPEIRASEDVVFGRNANAVEPLYFDPKIKVFHIFREETGKFLANQKLLGKYILVYRRLYLRSAVYRGIFPILLLPLFVVGKTARIIFRIAGYGGRDLRGFLISLPYFLLGILFWAYGFLGDALENIFRGKSERAAA